jgi:hypothetical protein
LLLCLAEDELVHALGDLDPQLRPFHEHAAGHGDEVHGNAVGRVCVGWVFAEHADGVAPVGEESAVALDDQAPAGVCVVSAFADLHNVGHEIIEVACELNFPYRLAYVRLRLHLCAPLGNFLLELLCDGRVLIVSASEQLLLERLQVLQVLALVEVVGKTGEQLRGLLVLRR